MAKVRSLDSQKVLLHIGGHSLLVEIAKTPPEQWLGLSGRERLDDDHGMIFVFSASDRHAFWMRGVPFPITVAFLNEQCEIVSTHDMEPNSEAHVLPSEPVRLALEAPRGWFARKGVRTGDKVEVVGGI